ncbi:hypothetical protein ACH4OX_33190 [Streptomyces roseolus]|uniref:hypothetical protein n=1 Tax=Streptomyces roseolus TaxID=67358 RepID=UPI003787B96E
MSTKPVRWSKDMLGYGVPAGLFAAGVAHIGITNGHAFIEEDFFAWMYCLASVQIAALPLSLWRRGQDPGLFKSTTWIPWAFTVAQGVAYSTARSDAGILMLIFGWGMFILPGVIAMYFLGQSLWGAADETATRDQAAVTPSGREERRP